MAGFYDDVAEMVQDLLLPDAEGGPGQGTVTLKRVTVTPPTNEWEEPVETVETWPLKAAVRRMHQRYDGGVLIVETGDMVTFRGAGDGAADFGPTHHRRQGQGHHEPDASAGAGVTVAYKAWCAA